MAVLGNIWTIHPSPSPVEVEGGRGAHFPLVWLMNRLLGTAREKNFVSLLDATAIDVPCQDMRRNPLVRRSSVKITCKGWRSENALPTPTEPQSYRTHTASAAFEWPRLAKNSEYPPPPPPLLNLISPLFSCPTTVYCTNLDVLSELVGVEHNAHHEQVGVRAFTDVNEVDLGIVLRPSDLCPHNTIHRRANGSWGDRQVFWTNALC